MSYRDLETGKVESRSLVSFKNQEVYAYFKDAQPGTEVNVTKVKEGDFWQWTAVGEHDAGAGAAGLPANAPATPSARPSYAKREGSTYETPKERAVKQRLIVRQSSFTSALQFMGGTKNPPLPEVFKVADQIADWVYQTDPVQAVIDLEDDIPQ